MSILINIWYIFSGIIGIILGILAFLCLFGLMMLLTLGLYDELKEKNGEMKFILSSILFCTIVVATFVVVNTTIPTNNKIVSENIPVLKYEGINNVKEGKFNTDYLYFSQEGNKENPILTLRRDECHLHYTEDTDKIRVVANHTEYLSPFRFFAIFSLEGNPYYDIYLPKQ